MKNNYLLITTCTLVLGVVVVWAVNARRANYGQYQTPEQVQARYKSCKDHAPKGMDCVMIPMLISNDYAKELSTQR